MLLNFAILLYALGLFGLVFDQALLGDAGSQSDAAVSINHVICRESSDRLQTKTVFGIAAAFAVGSYLNAWIGVYSKLQCIEPMLRQQINVV